MAGFSLIQQEHGSLVGWLAWKCIFASALKSMFLSQVPIFWSQVLSQRVVDVFPCIKAFLA